MKEVTDASLLEKLNTPLKEVIDPALLAQLNGKEEISRLDNPSYGAFGATPREIGSGALDALKFGGEKLANTGVGFLKGGQDVYGSIKRGGAGVLDALLNTKSSENIDAENKALNILYQQNFGDKPESNIGRVAGNVVGTIPVNAISPFSKLGYVGQILNGITQGAAGSALTSSAYEEPVGAQMTGGGLVGGAVAGALPVLGWAGKAIQPFTKAGVDKIAAKLMMANADNPSALSDVIENAPQFIEGSSPTVAQAAHGTGDYGINALERGVKNVVPDAFRRRAAEQGMAQNNALEGLMPAGTVERLKATREAVTSPLYEQARIHPADAESVVPVMGKIEEELANVGDTKAGELLKALRNKITSNFQYENSGPLIQLYKETRDDLYKKAEQEGYLGSSVKGVVGPVNKAFGKALADSNPALAQADATYSELSKPINQRELLQEIQANMQSPVSNYLTDEPSISLSKLVTQLKNRAPDIQKTLTTEQQSGLSSLRADLNRIASSDSPNVKGVSAQSLSNLGTKNLFGTLGDDKKITSALIDTPAISKLGGWVYGNRDPIIQQRLAELMSNPQGMKTAELIRKTAQDSGLSAKQRALLVNLLVQSTGSLKNTPYQQ